MHYLSTWSEAEMSSCPAPSGQRKSFILISQQWPYYSVASPFLSNSESFFTEHAFKTSSQICCSALRSSVCVQPSCARRGKTVTWCVTRPTASISFAFFWNIIVLLTPIQSMAHTLSCLSAVLLSGRLFPIFSLCFWFPSLKCSTLYFSLLSRWFSPI